MADDIDDKLLRALIEGSLSPAQEEWLETRIASDPVLRDRLDRLSGGDVWTPGSAPAPESHQSQRLTDAMQSISQRLMQNSAVAPQSVPSNSLHGQTDATSELLSIQGITIQREIARGGMGIVYEGIDQVLNRRVAIKFISPTRSGDTDARERMIREAQAAASLHHENIVSIHSIQIVDGTPILIQQLVDGASLQELIDHGHTFTVAECIDLARQLTKGLIAAHSAGIIHRDLKPGNVLIENHTRIARIADFGMAKRMAEDNNSTCDAISGTPAYMSPEQTQGVALDPRTDLFSLGAILYCVATGTVPFHADDPFVMLDRVRNHHPAAPKTLRRELPKWFSDLIVRLLEKNRDLRIHSATELLEAIDLETAPGKTKKPKKISLAITVGASIAVVAIAIASLPLIRPATDGRNGTPTSTGSQVPEGPANSVKILGQPDELRTIDNAVQQSKDGDTILLYGDFESEQISIVGKRLTIASEQGQQARIRPTAWAREHHQTFLRTDSSLTLRGLNIDWQATAELPISPAGKVAAIIAVSEKTAKLTVDDCTIARGKGGICIGVSGELSINHSWLTNATFAIAFLADDNKAEVRNSLISCGAAAMVLFPPANATVTAPSTIRFDRCSIIGDSAIDVAINRQPENPIHASFESCVLDTYRSLQITATNTFQGFLQFPVVAQRTAFDVTHWKENRCLHLSEKEHVTSRRLRQTDRIMSAGIKGLSSWISFWSDRPSETCGVTSAYEAIIQSQLPADLAASPWLLRAELHRITDPPPTFDLDVSQVGIIGE